MTPTPHSAGASTAGELLQFVRHGMAHTKSDLMTVSGLGRSAVTRRVEALLDAGLIYEDGDGESTGGRPPKILGFNGGAGVVLVADLGATHSRLAVMNLDGTVLAEQPHELDIANGPDVVLTWMLDEFDRLLERAGRVDDDVRAVGLGLPGPVEFAAGRVIRPPLMPGWDGVSVPNVVCSRHDVPVLVDNDVNIMALGEYGLHYSDTVDDLLFVKVGTGIGLGIIAGGRVHHGASGAAGDIGHIVVSGNDEACRCGNRGCLETLAGGAAIARRLSQVGAPTPDARGVVDAVRSGHAAAARLVRDAGRAIGEVLAGVVNTFNPAVIVIGGDLAEADQLLLAGIREVVYQRSTALATEHLELDRSRVGDRAGITGAAVMAIEHVLAPDRIDRQLASERSG